MNSLEYEALNDGMKGFNPKIRKQMQFETPVPRRRIINQVESSTEDLLAGMNSRFGKAMIPAVKKMESDP